MPPTVTPPRMTRIVAPIVAMVPVAAACGEGLSRQASGDAAGTVGSDSGERAPAKLYDPDSMASFSGELVGSEVALSPDSTTTGVIGGIRAGECPGDAATPYDRLVPSSGELYVDEEYIERSLGGQRIIQNFDVLGSIIIVADNVTLCCGRVRENLPYSIVVEFVDVVRSKLISFHKAPNAALRINVANRFSITDSYLWGGVYSISPVE